MPVDTRRTAFAAIVHPAIGIGPVRFGVFARDVVAALGTPAENRIDEDGDQLLAYPEVGISVFSFDHEEDMRLTTYELDRNSNAELWGLRVFRVPRSVISQAVAARGLLFGPEQDFGGGETLFQLRSLGLDFYFEGEILSALTAGVIFSADDAIQWPTAT
ncbi:MAG TPA: hypothetical protein VEX43_05135 [Chthoniobacterales bacterium]|nr:hypothetical protein [Chthoniobacterales bacterium]